MAEIHSGPIREKSGGKFCKMLERIVWALIHVGKWYPLTWGWKNVLSSWSLMSIDEDIRLRRDADRYKMV